MHHVVTFSTKSNCCKCILYHFCENKETYYVIRQKWLQNALGQFITKWNDKVITFWMFITKCTVVTKRGSTGFSGTFWHLPTVALVGLDRHLSVFRLQGSTLCLSPFDFGAKRGSTSHTVVFNSIENKWSLFLYHSVSSDVNPRATLL